LYDPFLTFLCAKSAVNFLDARKLLMSMTFARRNGLLAPDNPIHPGMYALSAKPLYSRNSL